MVSDSPTPTLSASPTLCVTPSPSPSRSPSPVPTPGEGQIILAAIVPNPVPDGFPTLSLEARGLFDTLRVKVFSPSGRRAGFWEGRDLPEGLFRYPLDMSLANGTYHYVVEMDYEGKMLERQGGTFFVLR